MVLSLTVDELLQAHFDTLVEEGHQKQVSLIARFGHRSPLALSFSLSTSSPSAFPASHQQNKNKVGLLVGRLGSSKRDLVVAVIPTPAVGVS